MYAAQGMRSKWYNMMGMEMMEESDEDQDSLEVRETRHRQGYSLKERGGGQSFSTSFWMRFSQAPLCHYRFKVIFDDIIFLLSGNIIEYTCF